MNGNPTCHICHREGPDGLERIAPERDRSDPVFGDLPPDDPYWECADDRDACMARFSAQSAEQEGAAPERILRVERLATRMALREPAAFSTAMQRLHPEDAELVLSLLEAGPERSL